MDLLRWILLVVGLLLVGAIWLHGRRHRPVHEESLFNTARRRWRRKNADTGRGGPEDVDLPEREAPDLGLDIDGLDDILGQRRESIDGAFKACSEASMPDASAPDTTAPAADDVDAGTHETRAPRTPSADVAAARSEQHDSGDGARRAEDGAWDETHAARADADDEDQSATHKTGEQARPRGDAALADEDRIVVLYVVALRGERLHGADLLTAFSRLGLEHGDLDIFHRYDVQQHTVFSVANAAEPGTFDPMTMRDLETPGVALFTRLPTGMSAPHVFDEMAAAARALATDLGGHALDGRQSTLTRQTEQAMRDELLDYEHRRNRAAR